MAIQILMPALSPTMTEGTLARWLVAEGDNVSSGDVIAEIETDKATMEVEALDDGVIAKIMVSEATENVAVNAVIALMTEEGESLSDADLASAQQHLRKQHQRQRRTLHQRHLQHQHLQRHLRLRRRHRLVEMQAGYLQALWRAVSPPRMTLI